MSELVPGDTDAAVREFVHAELVDAGVDDDKITDGAALDDDLGLDSLDLEELLASLEHEYGVKIATADAAGLSVADLVAKVVADLASVS
jgi:acyl carrier protein